MSSVTGRRFDILIAGSFKILSILVLFNRIVTKHTFDVLFYDLFSSPLLFSINDLSTCPPKEREAVLNLMATSREGIVVIATNHGR